MGLTRKMHILCMIPIHSGVFGACYSSIANNVKVILYFLISMIPLWWRHTSPSHAFSTSNGEGLCLHAGGREGL